MPNRILAACLGAIHAMQAVSLAVQKEIAYEQAMKLATPGSLENFTAKKYVALAFRLCMTTSATSWCLSYLFVNLQLGLCNHLLMIAVSLQCIAVASLLLVTLLMADNGLTHSCC